MSSLTYLYCVVAAASPPAVRRAPRGLPGLGRLRALEIDRGLFAIVADAPRRLYGEAAVRRGLSDLDWVSRAAVSHEAVVEHFIEERAVLPARLLTLYESDERALAHLRRERARLKATATRVSAQVELGVRLLFDASRTPNGTAPGRRVATGAAYLQAKRARRNAAEEIAARAQQTAAQTFRRLAQKARAARERGGAESAAGAATLLFDAAFLVPRRRVRTFRALAAREAQALAPRGYVLTLTGPWPPYSFVQD